MKELSKSPSTKTILLQDGIFKIDKSSEWAKELLLELSETSSLAREEIIEKSSINIQLKFTKEELVEIGSVIVMQCEILTTYITACVKTFKDMPNQIELEFKACFINEHFENEEAYKEETEIFVKNELYELYFLKKSHIPLFDVIHEQVYLNFDFYPQVKNND